MIPVSTHCDEYIDRLNLNSLNTKKSSFEYKVPPPSRGVGTTRQEKLVQNKQIHHFMNRGLLKGDYDPDCSRRPGPALKTLRKMTVKNIGLFTP